MSAAHNARNKSDYEGDIVDPTEGMIDDLVDAVKSAKEEVDFNDKKFKGAHDLKNKGS